MGTLPPAGGPPAISRAPFVRGCVPHVCWPKPREWPGDENRDDQCPGIDDSDTGGSFNFFSIHGWVTFQGLIQPAFSLPSRPFHPLPLDTTPPHSDY